MRPELRARAGLGVWERRGVDQQRRDGFLMEKVSRFLLNLMLLSADLPSQF